MREKLVIMAMMPGMFLQMFVPCYVGNEIWIEHDKLPCSFYSSNWIKFNVLQRKMIITVMELLKKDNFVKLGILPLTLITFTKVSMRIETLYLKVVEISIVISVFRSLT